MSTRVFRQCACSVAEADTDGRHVRGASGRVRRQLGALCPPLAEDGHGSWAYQVDLPRTGDRRRPRLHRRGLASEPEAQERMDLVRRLLQIPDPNDQRGLAEIVALVQDSTRHGGLPPDPDDVADRYRLGRPLRRRPPQAAG